MGFGPNADGSERLIVERAVFIALPRDLVKQLFQCVRLFAASSFVVELIPRVTRACKFLVVSSELLDSGCVHSTMASSGLEYSVGAIATDQRFSVLKWSCADKVLLVLRGERRSFAFVIGRLLALARLHRRTALDNRFPRAVRDGSPVARVFLNSLIRQESRAKEYVGHIQPSGLGDLAAPVTHNRKHTSCAVLRRLSAHGRIFSCVGEPKRPEPLFQPRV